MTTVLICTFQSFLYIILILHLIQHPNPSFRICTITPHTFTRSLVLWTPPPPWWRNPRLHSIIIWSPLQNRRNARGHSTIHAWVIYPTHILTSQKNKFNNNNNNNLSVTEQISAFIRHLRRIYRYENSYHNFEHALDVLQATQSYLKSEGMVPSPTILFEPGRMWNPQKTFDSGSLISSLGLRELFMLYLAAIGHDVGHPGFTNGFMVDPLQLLRHSVNSIRNYFFPLSEKRPDTFIGCF